MSTFIDEVTLEELQEDFTSDKFSLYNAHGEIVSRSVGDAYRGVDFKLKPREGHIVIKVWWDRRKRFYPIEPSVYMSWTDTLKVTWTPKIEDSITADAISNWS